MKQIRLILLIILIPFVSFTQNCSYELNEVDKFNGKVTKITKAKKVIASWQKQKNLKFYNAGSFSVKRIDSDYFLIFDYEIQKYKRFDPYNINSGTQLILLLANGEKITLSTNDKINGTKKTIIGIPPVYCSYLSDINYFLTRKEIDLLLQSKVTSIRFYRTESNGKVGYVDCEIKPKNQEIIKQLLMCLL